MKLRGILSSLLLSAALVAAAKPARPGVLTFTQPDGTTFRARLSGDEFSKRLLLEDGCALVQDADGFYCYAVPDSRGRSVSSGRRVGERVDAAVKAASRRAPAAAPSEARASRPAPARGLRSGKRTLVIPVQFADVSYKYTAAHLDAMLNQEGYSFEDATGSASDYFRAQFGEDVPFVFDVAPLVTLPSPRATYGGNLANGNDRNPALAVKEACELLEASVDFAQYDTDGDGFVDEVFVFFAGEDEAEGGSAECIWSHQWSLPQAGYSCTVDGVQVGFYAMTSELARTSRGWALSTIGSFCHEYSHLLGLHDLYDTDYGDSGGETPGVWGHLSLMDAGCYANDGRTPPSYCALELEILGLGSEETLTAGFYSLDALADSQRYFRMNTEDDDIYYLLECRRPAGWDAYVGSNGLLVYRINKSEQSFGYSTAYGRISARSRWELNEINCNPSHRCAEVMGPETPPEDYKTSPDKISGLFYPGVNLRYTDFTCEESPLKLSDIALTRTGVSFTVTGPIVMDRTDVFQDAVILSWHLEEDTPDGGPVHVEWTAGGEVHEVECLPYEDRKYVLTIEGLEPGVTYPVSVYIRGYEGERISFDSLIPTKSYYPGSYPAIVLSGAERHISGAFKHGAKIPLRVMNLSGATEVRWTFGGVPARVGQDGYYRLDSSGTLRAEVRYRNGDVEMIAKEISVK